MRITKPNIVGHHHDSTTRCTLRRRSSKVVLMLIIGVIVIFSLGGSNFLDWMNNGKSLCVSSNRNKSNNNSNSKYRGKQYWKDGVTVGVETIYETLFARFQIHKVKLPADGNKNTIINDWLWYDEADQINVLVQEDVTNDYIVFYQSKYAIQTPTYAIVGGLIEINEDPLIAAKRELSEELNMLSNDWIFLGSYRAAANRGGGITYTYLARHAKKKKKISIQQQQSPSTEENNNKQQKKKKDKVEDNNKDTNNDHVAVGELERQDIVKLTREQLLEYLLDGKFQEIKWTATIALALLKTT